LNLNIFINDRLIGDVGLALKDEGYYELGF